MGGREDGKRERTDFGRRTEEMPCEKVMAACRRDASLRKPAQLPPLPCMHMRPLSLLRCSLAQ